MTEPSSVHDICPICGEKGYHAADCPELKNGSSLGHVPEGTKWEFDAGVTKAFEDMLERSIPQYEVMRRLVFELACKYQQKGLGILDLGSSRGSALAPLVERFGAANTFTATEISAPMLEVLHQRFGGYEDVGCVRVLDKDLREGIPVGRYCVVQSVLTLMFAPIDYRMQIIQQTHDSLVNGGAFIVVEKVLGASASLNETFVDIYYQHKRDRWRWKVSWFRRPLLRQRTCWSRPAFARWTASGDA
jgi:tRNA (cmo5U34)-methyltransferase